MKHNFLIIFISTVFFSTIGCSPNEPKVEPPDPRQEILTVDENTYTVANVLTALQEEVPFQEIISAWTQENSTGLDVPGKDSSDSSSVEKLIKQAGHTFAFEEAIARQARQAELNQLPDFQSYIDDTVKSELYEKFVIEEILQNISFTEKELERKYELNKNRFKSPKSDRFAISGLYVKTDDKTNEQAWSKAQEAYNKLQNGADFVDIAKEYSEAPESIRGLIQEVNISDFTNEEIPLALMKLEDGEFSEIIPSGDKLLIYKRHKYIPPEYQPFESVKTWIREMAALEAQNSELALLYQKLKEKYQPSLNTDLLINPQEDQMNQHIISLPGIYEMTLQEFIQSAENQHIYTYKEKIDYVNLLAQKAVIVKEALERGWSEESVASIVNYYKNKWLTTEWINSIVQDRLPTEPQLRELYANNLNSKHFKVPQTYELYSIFFPANYSPEQTFLEKEKEFILARTKSMQAYQELQDGKPFAEVASKYSHSETHQQSGGYLGTVSINQLGGQRGNSIQSSDLKAGEFSEPYEINLQQEGHNGYEIYFVQEIQPERVMTYQEAKEKLLNAAKSKEYNEEYQRLFQKWESSNTIRFHSKAMDSVRNYLVDLIRKPDTRIAELYRYTQPEAESTQ